MSFTKEVTTIASAALPICEQWEIRRCRFSSDTPGPRLCITSGIHGDETVGQMVIFELSRLIQTSPENLTGTVDLYPMLNPLGLDLNDRMVPSHTRLDMNRAFPGSPDGTPLETMCYHILEDVKDADLTLDIHAGTNEKSELYQVRMNFKNHESLIPKAASLKPDVIWIYPDLPSFDSSLTGALSSLDRDAFILEADARTFNPEQICRRMIHGILCKMHEMGIWKDEPQSQTDAASVPVIYSHQNIERVTCKHAGIFIPVSHLGTVISAGEILGSIVSALEGEVLESVASPCDGLVFTQRSYSAVYPGTLLARIRKEAT